MALIEFQNNSAPYLNADNLNNNFQELSDSSKGNILWTNLSVTNTFNSQTIDLSSSNYNFYEIIYASNITTGALYFNTGKIPKGKGTRISVSAGSTTNGPYIYFRTVNYTNDTQLSFTDASVTYSSTMTTNNDQIIPAYVIGYK